MRLTATMTIGKGFLMSMFLTSKQRERSKEIWKLLEKLLTGYVRRTAISKLAILRKLLEPATGLFTDMIKYRMT
jgi:hypothetical protein